MNHSGGTQNTHEHLAADEAVKLPSNRSVGLVFATVFVVVAVAPWFTRRTIRGWALGVSVVFLVLAFVWPQSLTALNRAWMGLAALLHKIVSPIVLGVVFYLAVTPTGWVMRRLKKNPLRLNFDPKAQSYWIPRQPPGPDPKTMINQF